MNKRYVAAGIIVAVIVLGLASYVHSEYLQEERRIMDIDEVKDKTYDGKVVTVRGEYLGWNSGHGPPPVTKSDWVVEDQTGWIYVTGVYSDLDPYDDAGREIEVTGTIVVEENITYIEGSEVKVGSAKKG